MVLPVCQHASTVDTFACRSFFLAIIIREHHIYCGPGNRARRYIFQILMNILNAFAIFSFGSGVQMFDFAFAGRTRACVRVCRSKFITSSRRWWVETVPCSRVWGGDRTLRRDCNGLTYEDGCLSGLLFARKILQNGFQQADDFNVKHQSMANQGPYVRVRLCVCVVK